MKAFGIRIFYLAFFGVLPILMENVIEIYAFFEKKNFQTMIMSLIYNI